MIETIVNLSEILRDFISGFIYAYYWWLVNRFPILGKWFPGILS